MEQYTASNGLIVKRRPNNAGFNIAKNDDFDLGLITGVTTDQADALREFFRAEEDERLGRWRWPDEPRFVVYPWHDADDPDPRIAIVNESTGGQYTTTRATVSGTDTWAKVARAYFDAHPEPKPWHNAAAGEVWAIQLEGAERETAMRVVMDAIPRFFPIDGPKDAMTYGLRSADIVTGRRIWPEVDPS